MPVYGIDGCNIYAWSQFMFLPVALMVATYIIPMTKNYIYVAKKQKTKEWLWVDIHMLAALPITYMVPKAK